MKPISPKLTFITAVTLWGTIGVFRRFLPYSSGFLAMARGLIGMVFLLLAFSKKEPLKALKNSYKKDIFLLALSGVFIGINWLFLFEAYNYTSVANATLAYYMEPTFVVLFAPFVLKERLTPKKVICVLLSLLGMVFVSGVLSGTPPTSRELIGILYGLLAALLYATDILINKKVVGVDDIPRTLIQLFFAFLVMLPYSLAFDDYSALTFAPLPLAILLFLGVVHTGIAYVMNFSAVRRLSAQSVAILSYLDPVVALFLSAFFLKEPFTLSGIFGAFLILGSAIISEYKKK